MNDNVLLNGTLFLNLFYLCDRDFICPSISSLTSIKRLGKNQACLRMEFRSITYDSAETKNTETDLKLIIIYRF